MALTNFGLLTDEQLTIWKRDTWKAARDYMFLGRFMGDTSMSMIQRITELKQSEKGARAVITLVADLEGDGVAGDRTLKGNEEAGKSYDQVIRIDQLRHAQKSEGRMAEQKSIVNFREQAKDVLAYWLADRSDQLGFLTLSGVAYSFNTDGTARVGSDLPYLEFAADVTAPSTNRHRRWDVSTGLEAGNTAAVDAADKPSYDMLVEMKAYAKNNFMRPIRGEQGLELYNVFMTPDGIAKLKQDSKFNQAWRDAMPRAKDNPLFKGADVIYVDGLAIYEYRHVFHSNAWGAGSNVKGQRVLLCGAQAMAYADIGDPTWVEETDDYKNQQGIATGKILGLKKPVFRSRITSSNEDFSVLCVDTAR
jgi:N4-gp56 family major capsid protein